jgi:plastocyanin
MAHHDRPRLFLLSVVLAAFAFSTTGCDSPVDDLSGSSQPSRTRSIAIREGDFDPVYVVVRPGGEVTFINRDSVSHQIASDPHPSHGRFPALNSPVLAPGATFRVTMPSSESGLGYHDGLKVEASGFRGTIAVCNQITLPG